METLYRSRQSNSLSYVDNMRQSITKTITTLTVRQTITIIDAQVLTQTARYHNVKSNKHILTVKYVIFSLFVLISWR